MSRLDPVPKIPLRDDPTQDSIWKRWLESSWKFTTGYVSGPVTPASTDNAVARWDGTGGRTLQNSGVIIDDANSVTGVVSLTATSITTETIVSAGTTATVFNTVGTTVNAFGAATTANIGGTPTGTLTVNFFTNATGIGITKTLNLGTGGVLGSTTNVNIGGNATGATVILNAQTVRGSATSQNVFNTVATTIQAFGAATTLAIGAATGTCTIANATVTLSNATTLNMNGANPTIASTATGTLTLFNTNLLEVNAFGAASTVSMGTSSGTFTVNNSTFAAKAGLFSSTVRAEQIIQCSTTVFLTPDGRVYGTALHNNANPVNGTSSQWIASGTYTPTISSIANLDAVTSFQAQWIRVGNVVNVSGKVQIDPTTPATLTRLGFSLPIASNLVNQEDCAGTAFATGIAGQGAGIRAEATNDQAEMAFISGDVTVQPMQYLYQYEVL